MQPYLFSVFLLFAFFACDATAGGGAADTATDNRPDTASGTTGQLQGTWRSEDDSLHTLTFEGNLMIMGYEGQETGEPENYVVGQTCPDVPDAITPNGKGRYLSVPDAGRCYFIIKLNDQRLQMSFVGRGNTLRYIRE